MENNIIMKERKLPTFIIAGAARSGTTTLYQLLRKHPDVYMSPVKETNFFVNNLIGRNGPGDRLAIPDIDCHILHSLRQKGGFLHVGLVTQSNIYCALFEDANDDIYAIGEASPSYLYYSKTSSERIYEIIPRAKIIILLRNPIERALSNYRLFYMSGREYLEISSAMCEEKIKNRLKDGWEPFWDYLGLGLYARQVEKFLHRFGHDQVRVWLYEDFWKDPQNSFNEICKFIGIKAIKIEHLRAENSSKNKVWTAKYKIRKVPIIRSMLKIIPRPIKQFVAEYLDTQLGTRIDMPKNVRERLLEYYKEDILMLHQLLPHLQVTRWIEDEQKKLKDE